jgi:tetratricopeptide (TPR) repeat protein
MIWQGRWKSWRGHCMSEAMPGQSLSERVQALVAWLTPWMQDRRERETLLMLTFQGRDAALLNQIDYEGTAEGFTVRLLRTLAVYGEIDGGPALSYLLDTLRDRAGTNRLAEIDAFQAQLPALNQHLIQTHHTAVVRRRLMAAILLVMGMGIVLLLVQGTVINALSVALNLAPPSPTPPSLEQVEIGIIMGYFGVPEDGSISPAEAQQFAMQVYSNLENELEQLRRETGLPLSVGTLGPDVTGTITSEGEAAAGRWHAEIVLYGTLAQDATGQVVVTPHYYASPATFADALEMSGSYRLGSAIPCSLPLTDNFTTNRILRSRLTGIAQVFAALTYYVAEDYEAALVGFEQASASTWGTERGTDTVAILLGNTHLRLASVAAQKEAYDAAEDELDQAFAAYEAAIQMNADLATIYSRPAIALASATFVKWSLERQQTQESKIDLLHQAQDYLDQAASSPDSAADESVDYQGYFAQVQINFALLQYHDDELSDDERASLQQTLLTQADRIISKYNDQQKYPYLAAEAYWYKGLLAYGVYDCKTAIEQYEQAITVIKTLPGRASQLRQMFFQWSAAECYSETGEPDRAAVAFEAALAIAHSLNRTGEMTAYIAEFQSRLDGLQTEG